MNAKSVQDHTSWSHEDMLCLLTAQEGLPAFFNLKVIKCENDVSISYILCMMKGGETASRVKKILCTRATNIPAGTKSESISDI